MENTPVLLAFPALLLAGWGPAEPDPVYRATFAGEVRVSPSGCAASPCPLGTVTLAGSPVPLEGPLARDLAAWAGEYVVVKGAETPSGGFQVQAFSPGFSHHDFISGILECDCPRSGPCAAAIYANGQRILVTDRSSLLDPAALRALNGATVTLFGAHTYERPEFIPGSDLLWVKGHLRGVAPGRPGQMRLQVGLRRSVPLRAPPGIPSLEMDGPESLEGRTVWALGTVAPASGVTSLLATVLKPVDAGASSPLLPALPSEGRPDQGSAVSRGARTVSPTPSFPGAEPLGCGQGR